MKREQQKLYKELNKKMYDIIDKYSKMYKLKKKAFFIWTSKKDFFFSCQFHLGVTETSEELICSCKEICKPLWTDELLWEILKADECFSAPMSLRGNGAFTFYGLPYNSSSVKINNWEPEEIDEAVRKMTDRFAGYVSSFDSSLFYDNTDKIKYHGTLYELLNLIHLQDYEEAYLYANEMKDNYFIISDKKFPEYAMEYCKAHMQAQSE